jgi:hypothetical protein
MHSDKTPDDVGKHRLLTIFSTLLHEALHIVFFRYGCKACKTAKFCEVPAAHGRPFQLDTAELDEVVPRLLGIPVKMDGFGGIVCHSNLLTDLPSRHDMTLYNFSNVRLASEYSGDISMLLARTLDLRGYEPWLLLEEIEYNAQPLVNDDGIYTRIPDKRDAASEKSPSVTLYNCDCERY